MERSSKGTTASRRGRTAGCEPNQPSGYLPQLLPFAVDRGGTVFELSWQEWQSASLDAAYADALDDVANELSLLPEPGTATGLASGVLALLGLRRLRPRRAIRERGSRPE